MGVFAFLMTETCFLRMAAISQFFLFEGVSFLEQDQALTEFHEFFSGGELS